MALEPQAALEQAVLNAIRSQLSYTSKTSDRMFDGRPHPVMGKVFVSVWSDGGRRSQARTSLDELFGVNVTVTVPFVQPFDRWLAHRDDLELRLNAIRSLVHKDQYDFSICRAAATLAGYDGLGQAVGFREALAFDGFEPWREVGPDWFNAEVDARGPQVGVAQTARFGRCRRVQALGTMA